MYEYAARPLDVSLLFFSSSQIMGHGTDGMFILKPPFARPYWVIFILHPESWLPEIQPLAVTLRLRLGNLWVETYLHFTTPGAFEATDLRLKFGFDAHSKLKSYIREHIDHLISLLLSHITVDYRDLLCVS